MPGKESEKTVDIFTPDPEAEKKAKLSRIKSLLTSAGYGGELKKYRGDDWFRAVCGAGILRDGDGNAITLDKNVRAADAADRILNVNGAFFIAERETGNFRKFGSDGGDGFAALAYSTPPVIERPGVILRMLDYFGFNIPSVKTYKQQMQSVKGNPLYYKLHNDLARSVSNDFIVSSSKLPVPEPEKQAPVREENTVPEKAEDLPAEEYEPGTEPSQKTELPKQPLPGETAVSVHETEDAVTVTMADGSVRTFPKQQAVKEESIPEAPEEVPIQATGAEEKAPGEEKTEEKVSGEEKTEEKAVRPTDGQLIDAQLLELTKKEQLFPESSAICIAIRETKEQLEEVKKLGLPVDRGAAAFPDRLDAAAKAAKGLLMIDQMERDLASPDYGVRSRIFLGRENSADVKKEYADRIPGDTVRSALDEAAPAQFFRRIISAPAGLAEMTEAVNTKATQAAIKASEQSALSPIDRKLAELEGKAEKYPEGSPVELEILEARAALNELKQEGMPSDENAENYGRQISALDFAAAKLIAVDRMEYVIAQDSDGAGQELLLPGENTDEIKGQMEVLTAPDVLIRALGNDPAERFTRMLTEPDGVFAFDKEMAAIRLPGEEIKEEPSDIDRKLAELDEKARNYPESSPIGMEILGAKEALNEIKLNGLPEDPAAENYAAQLAAVRTASAKLLAVDQMEYIAENEAPEIARRIILGREDSAEIRAQIERQTSPEAIGRALGDDPAARFTKMLSDPAGIIRFEKDTVKASAAILAEKDAQEEKYADAQPEEIISDERKREIRDAQIDTKLEELSRREMSYPQSSPLGTALAEAKESLAELRRTGLPTDPQSPGYAQQLAAMNKAAQALLLADRMEKFAASLPPEKAQKIYLAREDSPAVTEKLKNRLVSSDAVGKYFADNPERKFRRILENGDAFARFERTVARDMVKKPAAAQLPEGAVAHGSVYKQPGRPGWQRVPGASEEDVRKSLEELSAMSADDRVFKKIAKAESEIPVLKKKEENGGLADRVEEMKKLSQQYPEGSVMRRLGDNAVKELTALQQSGLPADPASPEYKKQTEALTKATAAVSAWQRAEMVKDEKGLSDPALSGAEKKADKIIALYTGSALIKSVAIASPAQLAAVLTGSSVKSDVLRKKMKEEQTLRKNNDIPDSAERKGALYRMGPKEKWKQVPGASLKEVNDSLLSVMDEKHAQTLASLQKSKDNIHLTDASLAFGV